MRQQIQISSGKGPQECEFAVYKYLSIFLKNHPLANIIEIHEGNSKNCYKSVLLEMDINEMVQIGTIKWVCQSPFRKNHKRKNWFIEVSKIGSSPQEIDTTISLSNKELLRFETFHCSGKGGQNVNKVETGVRIIHLTTGLSVTSTTARTQYQNKKIALDKLIDLLISNNLKCNAILEEMKWLEHERIERGNAFATYYGMDFKI